MNKQYDVKDKYDRITEYHTMVERKEKISQLFLQKSRQELFYSRFTIREFMAVPLVIRGTSLLTNDVHLLYNVIKINNYGDVQMVIKEQKINSALIDLQALNVSTYHGRLDAVGYALDAELIEDEDSIPDNLTVYVVESPSYIEWFDNEKDAQAYYESVVDSYKASDDA